MKSNRQLPAACLAVLCLAHAASDSAGESTTKETPLPVRFAADRFFVTPVTASGEELVFFTDTGGGANMIYRHAVDRLDLEGQRLESAGESAHVTSLPPLLARASIPPPSSLPPYGPHLLIADAPEQRDPSDGLLGRTWFAGRVWELDYPRRSMALLDSANHSRPPGSEEVELGFQTDPAGRRTTHFPRITVTIDGDTLELLLDTGATVYLTDTALARLDDGGPAARGTSFIVESVFNRWRAEHPEWRVLDHADRLLDTPMIEVPEIRIGSRTVGPVWFTIRPDPNFHEYMSQWMDRRIDGALGGSALRYFRVIVDYPNAIAVFERPPPAES